MSHFQNKVVVVTGGSEGIGLALVEKLLDEGALVSTCSRKFDKLYSLQLKYTGSPLHTMTCDVSKPADCEQFIAATLKTFGRIDILINNAGISMRAEFKDASVTVLQQLMDVNFWGAVYCTKLALPSLLENKGTVVGISSIAGYRGLPGRSGYSASKHALQGWLEALRTELMDSWVHVMWISPVFTASNIRNTALDASGNAQGESPLEESALMTASECAAEILKAVAKKKRTLVLSSNGKQTVFLNRFSPSLADRLVHRFFYKNGRLIK